MKKSKEELMTMIDALSIDDDQKIALMEDVADSVVVEDRSEEIKKLEDEIADLKQKYKDRFLQRTEPETEEKVEEAEVEEPEEEEEKEIIDVKEI